MIKHPVFRSYFKVRQKKGEGTFILSDFGHHILDGEVENIVIPLIDGVKSTDEIANSLSGQIPIEAIYYTILKLEKNGFIKDVNQKELDDLSSIIGYLGITNQNKNVERSSVQMTLAAFYDVDIAPIENLFSKNGITFHKDANTVIAITDDYLNPEFKHYCSQARLNNQLVIPLKIKGKKTWLGPVLNAKNGCCITCLAHRIKSNRSIENFLSTDLDKDPVFVPSLDQPVLRNIGLNISLVQIQKWITNANTSPLSNNLLIFDGIDFNTENHYVTKRPQCSECGEPDTFKSYLAGPITYAEVTKNFGKDGGHRHTKPEETFERFKHHVSPITGVVEYLKPGYHSNSVDYLSYVAGHNFALKSYNSVKLLKQNMRMVSGGKGSTEAQAKTSALCEALERYSGVYQHEEPIVLDKTMEEIGDQAIHPNHCMQYSESQYAEREKWLLKGSHFNTVPHPFSENQKTDWAPAYSLTQNKTRFLPAPYLYYNYPIDPQTAFSFADSNGCAAGNTIEEAILQGFFEVIERDAVSIWWYNMLQRQAVDIPSFQDPKINDLILRYQELGREVWALDISMDYPIPVFVALTRNINNPKEEIVFGFGAHFDPKIALKRAVTEMNQFIPWVEKIRNNQIFFDFETSNWFLNATVANQPYLIPFNFPAKKAWEFPNYSHPTSITQDVLLCQKLVEQRGMEFIVHNQTRPDIGLHVVKVIIPGMRHFWARYAPGRLYDIPVQLGLKLTPTPEYLLNPISMFV